MTTIKSDFISTVEEALQQASAFVVEKGLTGPQAQAQIIGHDFPNTLGGRFALTSFDFKGQRNETRTYNNLASALMAFAALTSDNKRIWHESVAGKRRLVVES